MSLTVMRPGLLTTVQDAGRTGWQQHGVLVGGAMDPLALRLANVLVGNEEGTAALEITLLGPTIRFEQDTLFALAGADLYPRVDGEEVPMWRPVWVKAGSMLSFGGALQGCRAYLAVHGGFDLPDVLGSHSTYLRAGIGGFQGRALQAGDVLPLRATAEEALALQHGAQATQQFLAKGTFSTTAWRISNDLLDSYQRTSVRVMRGSEFDRFSPESQVALFASPFQVTAQSDRMGYRLQGDSLKLSKYLELISEAVTFGTVQVPAGGQPILLMADRQTTGGYPKIAQAAAVDFPVLAQKKPGDEIRFEEITVGEAQQLYLQREHDIRLLKQAVKLALR